MALTPHQYGLHFDLLDLAAAPRPSPLPPGTFAAFVGTPGNNTFNGTAGNDTFDMSQGGNDTVSGRAGTDTFAFGNTLTALDTIDGGNGNDTVTLSGNYANLVFGATTMTGVENLVLSNDNYTMAMGDGTVAQSNLNIDATAMGANKTLTFDGSGELNGEFHLLLGDGHVNAVGSALFTVYDFTDGFDAGDHLDGGTGDSFVFLDGDYSAGIVCAPDTLRNIDNIIVAAGHSYKLAIDNANTMFGVGGLNMDASALGAADTLTFDGSDETDSTLAIIGGAGNDTMIGGGGNDQITIGDGTDKVRTLGGDDRIRTGGFFDSGDSFDGGDGTDTLVFSNGVAGAITTGVKNIEVLQAERVSAASSVYNISLSAVVAGIGQTLTIDGTQLDSNDQLVVNASQIADAHLVILGGGGFDTITIGQSGFDVVRGGGSDDHVNVLGNLQETNRIDGGAGADNLIVLDGDYSDQLVMQSHTIRNMSAMQLVAGHDYNLQMADGNVAAGGVMGVLADTLGATDRVIFDCSAETNGRYGVSTGAADDVIILGAGDDGAFAGAGNNVIDASRGGNDGVNTEGGNDTVLFGATLTGADVINLGGGIDTIVLDGDYALGPTALPDVEIVKLITGNSYKLSQNTVTSAVTVNATHLGSGDKLTFSTTSSQAFTVNCGGGDDDVTGGSGDDFIQGFTGRDILRGSGGADDLRGGFGDDVLVGGGGKDKLLPGQGDDVFSYAGATDSTSVNFDTIVAVDLDADLFAVTPTINITVTDTGTVSSASFDADMTTAMNGTLLQNGAALLKVTGGTLNGHAFMAVDLNATAGYQAGFDLVIEVTGFTGTLAPSDFI